MKKVSVFLNIVLVVILACSLYHVVVSCISLPLTINNYNRFLVSDPELATNYYKYVINGSITLVINIIFFIALIIALFFFNYRFDGISLREKIAARLAESKEKRAQYRVEKAAADKQAAIEDKQKRLEELQAELDELKKE